MGKESIGVYDLGGSAMFAIYLRVSTDMQEVKSQRHAINQWCAAQGYDKASLQEYIDEGISGATFERPAFKKLLTDIASGKVSKVITFELTRLSRDFMGLLRVMEQIKDAGAVVEVPGEGIVPFGSTLEQAMVALKSLAGAQEREAIRSRIKSGIARRRETSPAWGRALAPNCKGNLGQRKEYDPALIQKIQAKRAKGRSYREIADDLEMSVNKVFRIARRSGDAQT